MIGGHGAQVRYNFRHSSRRLVQATFGAESYPTSGPFSWHVQDFRWQPPYISYAFPPAPVLSALTSLPCHAKHCCCYFGYAQHYHCFYAPRKHARPMHALHMYSIDVATTCRVCTALIFMIFCSMPSTILCHVHDFVDTIAQPLPALARRNPSCPPSPES